MSQTHLDETSTNTPHSLLIDRFAPRSDFSLVSHRVVDANPKSTYEAVRELDFTDVHGPWSTPRCGFAACPNGSGHGDTVHHAHRPG
jgi:hypothetical protein